MSQEKNGDIEIQKIGILKILLSLIFYCPRFGRIEDKYTAIAAKLRD